MAARCRPATRERYEALFGQGILERFGPKPLDEIGAMAFRAYTAELNARHVQAWPHLSLVRAVLKAAVEFGQLEAMPDLPPLPKRGKKLPDAPTDEEVRALIEGTTGWIRTAIALSVFAGLRSGEVRALEVRDIDLIRGRIRVRRAFSAGEVITPKSGDERIIPLAQELRELLAPALKDKLPAARVVVRSNGHTPSRQNVLSKLKAEQVRLGLSERSFHALRHYFCSTLIRRGASLEAVRVLAGHSALAITQRYVHASGADLVAAIGTLLGT